MAKVIYWVAAGALYAILAHGFDLRGFDNAGLVCWVVAWFSWALAVFFALGVRRD